LGAVFFLFATHLVNSGGSGRLTTGFLPDWAAAGSAWLAEEIAATSSQWL
jgi:hypothetical protein